MACQYVDVSVSRTPKSRDRLLKAPSMKSATGSPERLPLKLKPGDPMKTCRNCVCSISYPNLKLWRPRIRLRLSLNCQLWLKKRVVKPDRTLKLDATSTVTAPPGRYWGMLMPRSFGSMVLSWSWLEPVLRNETVASFSKVGLKV